MRIRTDRLGWEVETSFMRHENIDRDSHTNSRYLSREQELMMVAMQKDVEENMKSSKVLNK